MLAETVTVPELVPDAGEAVSQLWLLDVVQFSVPLPLLLTGNVCAAGFPAPAVAVKLSEEAETASPGLGGGAEAADTTSVAVIVCVEPPPLTVTTPE